ncbi:MAG: DNA-processing protein DprA [Lachnospiraceae bacterium]|nr:DNA-processing protein DprA [Lachnospiraceae bacterium]
MKFSNNAMSAILLCSHIGISSEDSVKPFSLGEWSGFIDKVLEAKCEPSVILQENTGVLQEMNYTEEQIKRIQKLISRAVAFELDNLAKKGINVVTQFDSDYPILLKRRLKRKTPPVLFYVGNIDLAKKIGIVIVGSRNVDEDGMAFTKKLVERHRKRN